MKTILVVEDNDQIREDIAEMLELANFDVITAKNGKEGIEIAKKQYPDLILSDILMPVVDGFSLLHMLRNDPKTETIPVIFVTSKTERIDFRNAMESGADDYITKPFTTDDLLKAIKNRLRRQEVLKKNTATDSRGVNDLILSSNNATLESLFTNCDTNIYQKKQVIYKEGRMPQFLFYIVKGKVKTYKTHEDGKQLVLELYNDKDFLGHVALLEEVPYKETAVAIEEAELMLIPKKDFDTLVHQNISVANSMIKMLANNVTEQEQHLLGIAYNTLRKKVADALTSLQNKYQANKNEPLYIDMQRDELAAIAGTATESLIRTLHEFKNENLIDIKKNNQIEIINPQKLRKLVR